MHDPAAKEKLGTKPNQSQLITQLNRIASEVAKDFKMLSAYLSTILTQIPMGGRERKRYRKGMIPPTAWLTTTAHTQGVYPTSHPSRKTRSEEFTTMTIRENSPEKKAS